MKRFALGVSCAFLFFSLRREHCSRVQIGPAQFKSSCYTSFLEWRSRRLATVGFAILCY